MVLSLYFVGKFSVFCKKKNIVAQLQCVPFIVGFRKALIFLGETFFTLHLSQRQTLCQSVTIVHKYFVQYLLVNMYFLCLCKAWNVCLHLFHCLKIFHCVELLFLSYITDWNIPLYSIILFTQYQWICPKCRSKSFVYCFSRITYLKWFFFLIS